MTFLTLYNNRDIYYLHIMCVCYIIMLFIFNILNSWLHISGLIISMCVLNRIIRIFGCEIMFVCSHFIRMHYHACMHIHLLMILLMIFFIWRGYRDPSKVMERGLIPCAVIIVLLEIQLSVIHVAGEC